MPSLYTQSDSNKRKTWFLMSFFFVFIILVGWIFSQAMQNQIILYIAVLVSIVGSFVSYWGSDKIILSMSKAKEIKREDSRQLYNLVENLCITAGLPVPKIYLIPDQAPNAFTTGRDAKHAIVVVTAGLLRKLEKKELEGVIAHELSHIGNRDILLGTVTTVLVGSIVLMADWFMRWSLFGRRGNNREENNQIQLIITIIAIVLALLAPIFAKLIQLAISRKREFLADANGALLTRYPEGLASALEKISQDNNELKVSNRAIAHLYIASPFKNKKKKFFAQAFMTHPPIAERIAKLRQMD